jgi:recombining binding protein (suppressor of hairless)
MRMQSDFCFLVCRCCETLLCVVPPITAHRPHWTYVKHVLRVPICLVRQDGVIYPTSLQYTYTPEASVMCQPTSNDILHGSISPSESPVFHPA